MTAEHVSHLSQEDSDGTAVQPDPSLDSVALSEPSTEPTGDLEEADAPPSHGYTANKAEYLRRLKRIEGQARGLQQMVDEDRYCIDILTQVSATTKALESFALLMLEEHLNHCVAQAVREGGEVAEAKLNEASAAIARLVRS